jgi:hypothetical protein
MPWERILADAIVVFHAAFVAFVVLGMVAILLGLALRRGWARNFWFRTLHLAAIGVVTALTLAGTMCPLTVLENQLRRQAGQQSYPGDFIGYWAHELLFFDAEPWVFTLAYTLFGLLVLGTFVLAPPRWPGRNARAMPGDLRETGQPSASGRPAA